MSTSFQCQKCQKQTPETNKFPEPEFLFCIHCGTRHKMVAAIGDYSWSVDKDHDMLDCLEWIDAHLDHRPSLKDRVDLLTKDERAYIKQVIDAAKKARGA